MYQFIEDNSVVSVGDIVCTIEGSIIEIKDVLVTNQVRGYCLDSMSTRLYSLIQIGARKV